MSEKAGLWAVAKLGELCTITTGDKDVNEGNPNGVFPFFTCAQEISKSSSYSFDGDALLIAGNGNFSVKKFKGKFEAYQRTYVLQNFKISSSYLYYFISHRLTEITKDNRGSTIRYIRIGNLTDYEVVFPSKQAQDGIVTKIEELFSELDNGVESLKTAREQLKVYRQALLKHAFEGKLTAQWREQNQGKLETAEALLERIAQERAERYAQQLVDWEASAKQGTKPKTPKVLPTLVVNEQADLPNLPVSWCWLKIGDIFSVYVGSTPSRKQPDFWNGNIPWVSSGEVAFCRIKKTKEKITTAGFENTSTEIHPVGTVLLAMIGEGKTRGQVAILDIPASHNQNTAAIRVSESGCSSDFVYQYFVYQYEVTRKVGSGNNQKALNKERVSNLVIPICGLEEMNEVVSCLDEKLTIIIQLEQTITAALQHAEALRQSILKRAFSGQLVPQDPNDEPASVLLERIKAEKASQLKPKSRKS